MKLRFYSLALMQLGSLHKGIQTAHVVAEVMARYRTHRLVNLWAQLDKTIIILNGGNFVELGEFYNMLVDLNPQYPFAIFNEDASLNQTATAVGIILPASVYDPVSVRRMTKVDRKIYEYIKERSLAI